MPQNVYIYNPHVPVPKNVRHLEIPEGVRTIGEISFWHRLPLRSVTISDSVTEIGDNAFHGCYALKSVTVPGSVTKIGDYAFRDCSGLQSIVIPDSVTEIGNGAFWGCSSLQSVIIPDSITKISDDAFYNCSGISSVTIPDSVTKIGNGAFKGCSGLQSVVIPDSVTDIQAFAFRNCSGLQSVTIPGSVTNIEAYAFDGCSGLQSVTIPESITEINMAVFSGCSGLQSVTIPDSVTEIKALAFFGCSGLRSIAIPDSITMIESNAFYGCSRLQSIAIPDGVTEIGESAFWGCSGLQSIVIPDGVTEIGESAFWGCSGLQSIVIPDGVTKIGDSAFWECSALQSVTIPDNATEIGACAFYDCSAFRSVTIPDSVTKIGNGTFWKCSGLQSVTIPDGVTKIGESAFWGCSGLQSVTIPNSVTEIGKYAFSDCSSLQSVKIPDSVTKIGENAFHRCPALQSLMYSGTNIATFINIDGHGVNTFDVIKKLIDRQIPLREDTVTQGICMQHRDRLSQWMSEYPIFGNVRLPATMKRVSKKGREQLRKCFAAQKKTKGHIPEILDELVMVARIFKIPSERLTEAFDIEYTKRLLSEKIPIVPAEASRCYYSRDICNMLIRKGKISVMAEAVALYNKSGHQECYRHLMEFIRSHPDTKTEDLRYAVDHATEIPIGVKTTLTQVRQHRIYMENLTEVTKIETKYGKVVPGFKLSDYPCSIEPAGITYDGMTARVLDLSDARDIALAARLGELTSCCQRLNEAGETAMMHGFLNPDAGFWVIEDANETVKAQAEVWEASPNNLVFDNIEFANTDNRHTADRAEQLRGVIAAWAMASGYKNIIMGCGFNELGTETMEQAPIPELCLTPEEVFTMQKGNDAGVSFGNIDEARRYMQTEEYNPNDFVYTDADKKCVYIKKDGVVSDYLMQGYDRSLADKCFPPGHESVKEQDDEIVCK